MHVYVWATNIVCNVKTVKLVIFTFEHFNLPARDHIVLKRTPDVKEACSDARGIPTIAKLAKQTRKSYARCIQNVLS